MTDSPDVIVPPAPPDLASPDAPAAPVQGVVSSLIEALLTHSPDSLRRLGAALTMVAVPFLNSACQAKLGFSVPETQVLAIEAGLTVYIGQSFAKALKLGNPS